MYKFKDIIEEVEERNTDLRYGLDDIVGVTIEKGLIPTIANLVQTSLDKFYIVKSETFVYNPRTHGVRLGMGFNNTTNIYITSWNNVAFRVKKEAQNIVIPHYLWLYFCRPIWDRLTNFLAWGSSTIVFAWKDFLNIDIDLPSIERQREIVEEYETLSRRIRLNEQMIQNLEATAQALYRKIFVDNIDKENLPEGWRMGTVEELAEIKNGKSHTPTFGEIPIYGGNGIVGYTNEYNAQNVVIIGRVGINCGSLYLNQNNCYVNDNAMMAIPRDGNVIFLYMTLMRMGLNNQSEGSGQPLLTQAIIYKQECVIPKQELRTEFENKEQIIISHKFLLEKENIKLTELQSLLLAKMGRENNKVL